jgi:K(+)-stimulated pyrophosphate-energized sodium pump
MVEEVRRQFREIVGIHDGKADPDYARCVEIRHGEHNVKRYFLHYSLFPFLLLQVSFLVSPCNGTSGWRYCNWFYPGYFHANSGGAWDNAKKYIEEGNLAENAVNATRQPW